MRALIVTCVLGATACAGAIPGIGGGDDTTGDDGTGGGGGGGGGTGGGGGGGQAGGRLRIAGNQIVDESGAPVRLTGINWFGLETDTFAPHGLWQERMDTLLDKVVAAGFNTLRVPFSTQALDAASIPKGIDANLDLAGKTPLEILDTVIDRAGARGLRVIIDRHRPDAGGQSPLWYTSAVSEQRWIADWVMLAQRYRDNPVVIAFDLHNEPHANASWGDGVEATDWRLAAQRAGNAILAVHPDALILVEGIETYANNYYWWGGNLRGAMTAPIELAAPGHVIYSPHEYPASLYMQPWFSDPTYPANLAALWDTTWGNLAASAPVLVGEFGTKLQLELDKQWLGALVQYIQARGLSFTFWALNPNSGDTGGILRDDWITVDQEKLGYLAPALAPLVPVAAAPTAP